MTQSRPSAKACSARRRSSREREACTRCAVTPRARRSAPSSSTSRLESQNTRRFSPRCSCRDDLGGVLDGPHVVKLNVQFRLCLIVPERARVLRIPPRFRLGGDDRARAFPRRGPLQPAEQGVRVADGGGQPDPLQRPTAEPGQPFKDGEQMPSPVSRAERVDFVHHDHLKVREQPAVIDVGTDQHRLEGLGRGEEQVGRTGENGPPARSSGVAVPESDPPARPAAVGLQSRQEVVEQRLQRAKVQRGQPGPAFGRHPGEHREGSRFGLSARRRRQQERVLSRGHGRDGRLLQRPELGPAERADQMVRQRGMQSGQLTHRSSSTSSAEEGRNAAALRSTSVSSVPDSVSL